MQVCDEGFEKKKRCVRKGTTGSNQHDTNVIIPGATDLSFVHVLQFYRALFTTKC